ncbi:FtsW/RodA/SpoVE family cell cycle protein [Patescibacteria group bacterium]|nr:FtsW/RodA/SpoVE family cell cycle protein [Patescibacteria group bacterium]
MKLNIDYWLLAPVVILTFIGLATLASINPLYFRNQIISLIISVVFFLIISQINISSLKILKNPLYIVSLVLLLIVLIIGIESRGAVRWVEFLGIRIQFSETLKPLLSLSFAAFISDNKNPTFKTLLIAIVFLLPVIIMIYLQPDLGSALIYTAVFFLALIVIGFPIYWFGITALPAILLSPLFWTMLHEYQRQRILTFFQLNRDPLGASYNSIQALIAVGSGMFSGKGLGEGTQSILRFLPERHTDFIFATISEGMGFVGGLIIILAFLFLLYRIYFIFIENNSLFEKIFLICCFFFFLIQFFLNVGMNIGLLPVVGVTMPFVSFGGSSLMSSFIFLAIASSISISHKKRNVLEIR